MAWVSSRQAIFGRVRFLVTTTLIFISVVCTEICGVNIGLFIGKTTNFIPLHILEVRTAMF